MGVFKYLNIPVFIVSLAIGIFIVYVSTSETRTIYVYPTPENIDLIQYRDKANNCFSMKSEEVTCPANEADISKVPVQT